MTLDQEVLGVKGHSLMTLDQEVKSYSQTNLSPEVKGHYGKKMFRLCFEGCNDEISAQVRKGNKANIYLLL